MRTRGIWLTAVPAILVMCGCASSAEWTTWKAHPAHFASGEHLKFSLRNSESAPARVTRRDVVLASDQGWWGKPITVDPGQILER